MVELEQESIVIVGAQRIAGFLGQAVKGLDRIDGRQIIQDDRRKFVGFCAALPFIVAKPEGPVFLERTAKRHSKLVLPQYRIRSGKDGLNIQRIVHAKVIDGAVQVIAAGLGHNIDEAAQRATIFRGKGVVDNTELLRRLL